MRASDIPVRAFRVEMGQGWRDSLQEAVTALGFRTYARGYGRDSTTWIVCVVTPEAMSCNDVSDALRRQLSFAGWLSVEMD
jgi:hypothetical protein